MAKNDREKLPIIHVSKQLGSRQFEGDVAKRTPDYMLIQPDRQFIIEFVKFAPGKGPQDWVDFHKATNVTRCKEKNIHEIATFLTWGEYDMVVLWDAPDMKTYNEYLASTVNPQQRSWQSNTQIVPLAMKH